MFLKNWFLVLAFLLPQILSEKVLFIALTTESSHRRVYLPILNGLLERKHQVTAIVNGDFKIQHPNFNQILVKPDKKDFNAIIKQNSNHENRSQCVYPSKSWECFMKKCSDLQDVWLNGRMIAFNALLNSDMQIFMKGPVGEFDLVIAESFVQEVMYMFSFVHKAPLVLISSKDYSLPHVDAMGAFSIWSQNPFLFQANDPSNILLDRFLNRLKSLILVKMREQFQIRSYNLLSKEFFSNIQMYSKELPSILDLEGSASMVIFNSLQMLSLSNPKKEGIVDIAGIHIRKKKELPNDVKKFMDSANKGVIYFDLDAILRMTGLKANINMFISMLKKLNYKFLIKYTDESVKPTKSIMVKKHISRNDVLANRRVKLFISHADILGIQEAAFHGVPMMVIPMYGDQFENAKKVQEAEVGLSFHMEDLTPANFENCIRRITQNSTYAANIKKVSEIFKSDYRPIENTLYWLEYVMKNKEDYYFKPSPRDAPFYEYLFLDFICIGYVFLLVLRIIFWKIVKMLKRIWNCFKRILSIIFWRRKVKEVKKEEDEPEQIKDDEQEELEEDESDEDEKIEEKKEVDQKKVA